MSQITVRAVQFHDFKPCMKSTLRPVRESIDYAVNLFNTQLMGSLITLIERNRAGCYRLPAVLIDPIAAPAPWHIRTGFPSCMGRLNARDRPLLLCKTGDTGQRLNVLVGPNTHVRRRDAPARLHGSGFHHN